MLRSLPQPSFRGVLYRTCSPLSQVDRGDFRIDSAGEEKGVRICRATTNRMTDLMSRTYNIHVEFFAHCAFVEKRDDLAVTTDENQMGRRLTCMANGFRRGSKPMVIMSLQGWERGIPAFHGVIKEGMGAKAYMPSMGQCRHYHHLGVVE